jgi:putative NADH-flavin reductase
VKSLASIYLEILSGEKELDWVFFSPAGDIAPGKRTGKFRLGKDELVVDQKGESKISVEDYAVAMIDELEKPAHHRERFTIGY